MTQRDRLQRLLFEHRIAHDSAPSEREILAIFEALEERPAWQYTLRHMGGLKPYLTQRQYEAQSPAIQKWYEPVARCECTLTCLQPTEGISMETDKRDGEIEIKTAGNTRPLFYQPGEFICGTIGDGVAFRLGGGGYWFVSLETLRKIVADEDKLREEKIRKMLDNALKEKK